METSTTDMVHMNSIIDRNTGYGDVRASTMISADVSVELAAFSSPPSTNIRISREVSSNIKYSLESKLARTSGTKLHSYGGFNSDIYSPRVKTGVTRTCNL